MEKKIPTKFIGEIEGNISQITPELSKGRLRIFYKGLNRNQGYITDEFANRLLSSLPYTPVVGIYNDLTKEFGGHNSDRNIANTYGVVPQQPNLSWEDHLDKDGIVRTYACCDVILFTGRYEAANRIIGKQQSMELDEPTIVGQWEIIDQYGTEAFVYTDARFIGLSVLGDNKEPCFEGSAFFELVTKFNNFMTANTSNGGKSMSVKNTTNTEVAENMTDYTASSDSVCGKKPEDSACEPKKEPEQADSAACEPKKDCKDQTDSAACEPKKDCEEQSDSVCKPKEDSACDPKKDSENQSDSACDPKKDSEEQADSACDPKKNSEQADSAACGTQEPKKDCEQSDSAACEPKKDCTIDCESQISELNTKISEKDSEILDLRNKISTYETEANNYKNLYNSLKADYDTLVTRNKEVLAEQKQAKLNEYTSFISETVVKDFESKLESYSSVDDLEKDLLFAAKPSLFANHDNFAPTSTYENEEDDLAELIRESIKK